MRSAAGACGVLSAERDAETLVDVVPPGPRRRAGAAGGRPPGLVDRLRDADATRRQRGALDFLTGREHEILRLLADGSSTSEIASELGISPMTVQSHVKNILAKLGVHSKVEAVTLGVAATVWAPTTRTA